MISIVKRQLCTRSSFQGYRYFVLYSETISSRCRFPSFRQLHISYTLIQKPNTISLINTQRQYKLLNTAAYCIRVPQPKSQRSFPPTFPDSMGKIAGKRSIRRSPLSKGPAILIRNHDKMAAEDPSVYHGIFRGHLLTINSPLSVF